MNIRNVSSTDALLRSGLHSSHDREKPAEKPEKPAYTITISREVGALGLKVADAIGKRLNWPVFNHELLDKITEALGRELPTGERKRLDERHVGWLEEFLLDLCGGGPAVTPTMYVKKLVHVVQSLGKKGKCVIVGRGANFILPAETTVRVRLVADIRDRVPRIAEIMNMSESEAVDHIEKTDRARAQFVRDNFEKNAAEPHEYDLLINTSSVSTEEAAELIIETLHRFEKRAETLAAREPAMTT
jgi:cytidylate kinase